MSQFIINSFIEFPVSAPELVFESDYTDASDWTQTGSKVTVDSGKADWCNSANAQTNDSLQQVIQDMNVTLDDTEFYADWTYINATGGTVGGYPLVFQSSTGNYDTASNDAIAFSESNANKVKLNSKNSGSYVVGTGEIGVTINTTYYMRLERLSATELRLSVFTDSDRTTHATGSPVTATNANVENKTDLTHVQSQNQTSGGGGGTNFEVTDLSVYNGLPE